MMIQPHKLLVDGTMFIKRTQEVEKVFYFFVLVLGLWCFVFFFVIYHTCLGMKVLFVFFLINNSHMCLVEKKVSMVLFYNSSGYKKTQIKYTCIT